MILYEHPTERFTGSSYDDTYAEDVDHFSHKQTFSAIDHVLTTRLKSGTAVRCMDLGCGQGQVLAYVAEHPALAGLAHEQSSFYGIDVSRVAIHQCNDRYPNLIWIQDSFQEFLDRPQTGKELFNSFNLVINKGGLTFVSSENEYERMMRGIQSLLNDGGMYLYIQNKRFYQHWCRVRCTGWSQSVFDIAQNFFGPAQVFDNAGYYRRVYTKSPSAVGSRPSAKSAQPAAENQNIRAKPLHVQFTLSNGEVEECFAGGDDLIDQRLQPLIATAFPLGPGRGGPEGKVVPGPTCVTYVDRLNSNPHPDPLPSWGGAGRNYLRAALLRPDDDTPRGQRERDILALTASRHQPGRPTVLMPGYTVRVSSAKRLYLAGVAYDALDRAGLNVLHHPELCKSVRKYCTAVDHWLAAEPDVLILGTSLEDHAVELPWNKPDLELDEFMYRVDYVLDRLRANPQIKIAWVAIEPHSDFIHNDNTWMTRLDCVRKWADAAESVCRGYGVPMTRFQCPQDRNANKLAAAVARCLVAAANDALGVTDSRLMPVTADR